MLEHLWAGWRNEYVVSADASHDTDPCIFCRILNSGLPDDQTYVVWRGERSFAILNAYPYTSGHLMVMPLRHVSELDELTDEEGDDLFRVLRHAVHARKHLVDTLFDPVGDAIDPSCDPRGHDDGRHLDDSHDQDRHRDHAEKQVGH